MARGSVLGYRSLVEYENLKLNAMVVARDQHFPGNVR